LLRERTGPIQALTRRRAMPRTDRRGYASRIGAIRRYADLVATDQNPLDDPRMAHVTS